MNTEQLDQLERENAELTKALTGLTCGGSEFFIRKGERYVADIPACVAYVNQVRTSQHETICREVSARQASEALSQSLQEEVERLRGALKPFAREVERFGSDEPCVIYGDTYELWQGAKVKITVGDLRRAQSALTATDPKTGGEG